MWLPLQQPSAPLDEKEIDHIPSGKPKVSTSVVNAIDREDSSEITEPHGPMVATVSLGP